jgi:hypothetical protein
MKPSGRSAEEIAVRIGHPPQFVDALLRDSARRGLVAEQDGRWRLTASAERRYGRALRQISLPGER